MNTAKRIGAVAFIAVVGTLAGIGAATVAMGSALSCS